MFGVIRKWRGHYGYIEPNSGSEPRVFVHQDDMPEATRVTIHNGCVIEFDIDHDARGPRAKNIRVRQR
jgi:cold shock CspA family protein